MSLEKVTRSQIPPGATILTRKEVIDEYWEIIMNWKPSSDVAAIRFGLPLLSGVSFLTNFTMLLHYRRRLKLGRKAFLLMGATCAVMPSVFSPIGHMYFVTNELLLERSCPVCAQTRAMAIQAFCSFSYSLTITPILCFMKAQMLCTYNVPGYYTKEGRAKTWQLYKKFTKRASGKLYSLLLLNTIAGTAITAFEMKSIDTINDKLFKKKEEVVQLQKELS